MVFRGFCKAHSDLYRAIGFTQCHKIYKFIAVARQGAGRFNETANDSS